jgi:WD40 repeat protein
MITIAHSEIIEAISINYGLIATGSRDCTINLFQIEVGKCIRRLKGHEGWITAVKVKDQYIISASEDQTVKVWSRITGHLIRTIKPESGAVRCIDFHLPLSLLCLGTDRGIVQFWNFRTGERLHQYNLFDDYINSVSISGNSRFLVTGGYDCRLNLIDLKHRTVVFETIEKAPIEQAIINNSGNRVAYILQARAFKNQEMTGRDVQVIDLDKFTVAFTLNHDSSVWSIRFSEDNQSIITGSKEICTWNAMNGELEKKIESGWWNGGLIDVGSVKGMGLIAGCNTKQIKVWDQQTGTIIKEIDAYLPP